MLRPSIRNQATSPVLLVLSGLVSSRKPVAWVALLKGCLHYGSRLYLDKSVTVQAKVGPTEAGQIGID